MATAPVFASIPRSEQVVISVANTNRNGTGTLGTVINAQSGSTLLYKVQVNATGSTTAGVVRLFQTNNTQTVASLLEEIIVPAITPSTTVRVFEYVMTYPQNSPLVLVSGSALKAGTNNAEPFVIFATGGDI